MSSQREGTFRPLGSAIHQLMRSRGLVRASRASLVPVIWAEVVGDWYARHTEVIRVQDGVVTVWCDTAALAQQLQLDSPKVIEALNKRVGGQTVKEIRPSSGGIRRPRPPGVCGSQEAATLPTAGDLARVELSPQERSRIEQALTAVEDPELRRVVEAVMVKEYKAARWRREHGYQPCPTCSQLMPPGRKHCAVCSLTTVPLQGSTEAFEFEENGKRWVRMAPRSGKKTRHRAQPEGE